MAFSDQLVSCCALHLYRQMEGHNLQFSRQVSASLVLAGPPAGKPTAPSSRRQLRTEVLEATHDQQLHGGVAGGITLLHQVRKM